VEELIEFIPQNAVERKLADEVTGACTNDDLVETLRGAAVYVASRSNMTPDGNGFSPLLMSAFGDVVLAAFTASSRLGLYPEYAQHAFEMRWRDFILSIPPGKGAVLNPGYTHQKIIPADEVRRLKSWLGTPQPAWPATGTNG
jgi:hypothetical protein